VEVSARSPCLIVGSASSSSTGTPFAISCFVDGADRVAALGHLAGREREHRVRLVERGEPVGVTGVRPLDKEACEILRLGRPVLSVGHRLPFYPVGGREQLRVVNGDALPCSAVENAGAEGHRSLLLVRISRP
jgi:translation initiation factor IF-1